MKKAIVVGASSGIGKNLAKILAHHGYEVGLVARRLGLLEELQREISTKTYIKQIDISRIPEAIDQVDALIKEMGHIDLFICNAAIGFINPELEWKKEEEVIDVNVRGFSAMSNVAMRYFLAQGKGHLVGISSLGALRGNRLMPAYNASKAFISNYLESIRQITKNKALQISVTDIKPGFVDTEALRTYYQIPHKNEKPKNSSHRNHHVFWAAPPKKAAYQIYLAIQKQSPHAYITRRYRYIAWLMKILPRAIYDRFV